MRHYAGNRIEREGQCHRDMPEMVGLDASCMAPIPASVSAARATLGPRRTYARALGDPERAPKDAGELAVALDQAIYVIRWAGRLAGHGAPGATCLLLRGCGRARRSVLGLGPPHGFVPSHRAADRKWAGSACFQEESTV
jgi:hypothetical protein